jgi:K+ transporter
MYIWHLGAAAVFARLQEQTVPVDAFMARMPRRASPVFPAPPYS